MLNSIMSKKENFLNEGYQSADEAVKKWNSQPNPLPVYIDGYRIHHGLVGVGCTAVGGIGLVASALSDNKKTSSVISDLSKLLLGIGIRLMEDDIKDAPDWFNFEKDNSNPSQNQQDYSGFA